MSEVGAVAPAPVTETVVTAATTVAPVVETVAPVTTTAPVETVTPAPITTEVKAETILASEIEKSQEPPKVEAKEPPKVEEKNTEGDQSVEPAPPPTYEPFKVPENIKLDTQKVTEFTSLLAELEQSGKASHEAVQAFGQKAVDFYINETTKVVENIQNFYKTSFENQKTAWKDLVMNDPEIGGNRFRTSLDSALNFIRTHGGTQEQQAEFKALMETSGIGNHPAMIRLLAKAGAAMSEGRPLQATLPPAPPKSKVATLYGNSN